MSTKNLFLKGCNKCGGDVRERYDEFTCLQCGELGFGRISTAHALARMEVHNNKPSTPNDRLKPSGRPPVGNKARTNHSQGVSESGAKKPGRHTTFNGGNKPKPGEDGFRSSNSDSDSDSKTKDT